MRDGGPLAYAALVAPPFPLSPYETWPLDLGEDTVVGVAYFICPSEMFADVPDNWPPGQESNGLPMTTRQPSWWPADFPSPYDVHSISGIWTTCPRNPGESIAISWVSPVNRDIEDPLVRYR